MDRKWYYWCAVFLCTNTSKTAPHKVFVSVPFQPEKRLKWLQLAKRKDAAQLSYKSVLYFCEDHFDLPNDMENYMQYKIMGSVKKIRMKPGCMPSRFECHSDQTRRRLLCHTNGSGMVRGVPPPMPQPIPTVKIETASQDEDPQTGDEEMQPQQVKIKQEFEDENHIVLYVKIGPEQIGTTPAQPTDEDPISIHRIQPSTSTAASDVDPLVKTEISEEPEIRDSDSDIESALDTPKEAELRRIIKKKDKIIEQQEAKTDRLQELVRKLKQGRCKVCNSELS